MPIYEYRCQSCDKVLEVLVRNGKEPEVCTEPDCQGELVRKMSRAGVIFKGSGFYVTDSKSTNPASESKSDSGSSGSDSKGDSATSSDSKSTASAPASTSKSDSSSKSSD